MFFVKSLSNTLKLISLTPSTRISLRFYKVERVRVRFAPSPTGYLHLGGLRTALYNFLFAKKHDGVFILRLEDTDRSRVIEGAADALQNDLLWSGIEIHEGPSQGGLFGPYIQSERLKIYRDHVDMLLGKGSAYQCFCTDRRLQLLRKEAVKSHEIPKYDNRCRHLSKDDVRKRISAGDPYCVRFKISDQEETFHDLIYGKIGYNISMNEGDPVIIKSDGYPTYHFANVVDDHLMEISHVLRGVEWQISTTKHLLLYRAFGWNPPHFGHLPLLMNANGTKLSKRQGDIKISHYRDNNIFPLALINFIVNSGGGFDKDQEKFLKPKSYTIEELCRQFDISKINSHSGKLVPERLLEFNSLELKRQFESVEGRKVLVKTTKDLIRETFPERAIDNSLELSDEYITKILSWALPRITKLTDLVSKDLKFIWTMPTSNSLDEHDGEVLAALTSKLNTLDDLKRENINLLLRQFSKDHNINYSQFMMHLRLILSGLNEGPSVAEMMEILGKGDTLKRIGLCLKKTAS